MLTDIRFHIPNHARSEIVTYNTLLVTILTVEEVPLSVGVCRPAMVLMLFSPGTQRTSTTPSEEDNRHLVVAGLVAFGDIEEAGPHLWIDSYLCVDW